jgi:NADH:ubiquinone oxidoreductase subunit 5 (subunit L)/multisubunit Na+/H+ antiporter MnhA subunit
MLSLLFGLLFASVSLVFGGLASLGMGAVILAVVSSVIAISSGFFLVFDTLSASGHLALVLASLGPFSLVLRFSSSASPMLLLVMSVWASVFGFSFGYLLSDLSRSRFLGLLAFFGFAMLLLVLASSPLLLFIAWEWVGLCSWALIGFWYLRLDAVRSGMQAVLVNKVGDVALLFFVLLDFAAFDSLVVMAPFLLLVSSVSKSAQWSLHLWLPNAMEGPTPVSALLHAATMVTAGVFLLWSFAGVLSPAFDFLLLLGAVTSALMALLASLQVDIKRMVAYSTGSQLGYMVLGLGSALPDIALLHLVNHGFFKGAFFMACGVLLHGLCDVQDLRLMGGLAASSPVLRVVVWYASLSLMGFPGTSAFGSKDAVMLAVLRLATEGSLIAMVAFPLAVIGACCTAAYSGILWSSAFAGTPRSAAMGRGMDEPWSLVGWLGLLVAIGALWTATGSAFFGVPVLVFSPASVAADDIEYLGAVAPFLVVLFALCFRLGYGMTSVRYGSAMMALLRLGVWRLLVDRMVGALLLGFLSVASSWSSSAVDKGLYEALGGSGTASRSFVAYGVVIRAWGFGLMGYVVVSCLGVIVVLWLAHWV